MEEVWKDIQGFEGQYKISNTGKVIGFIYGRSLTPSEVGWERKAYPEGGGYLSIRLSKQGVSKHYKIHRLVALHFIPNPNNYEQVNHKDGNRVNNLVFNLEWVSRRENNTHWVQNHKKSGSKRFTSKYYGVSKGDSKVGWNARLQINKVGHYLGFFKTELEAHQAVLKFMKERGVVNKYV